MGALRRRGRALGGIWQRARRRFGWLDHVARASTRYLGCHADRLAAALAYYAFFAVFALTGVGFAVLGWLLREDAAATRAVQQWVDQTLPGLDVAALAEVGTKIGVIALAALLVAGMAWVKGLRSAVRTVWGLEEQPGRAAVRFGVDLAVLVALGVLLLVSVGIAVGVSA
ncbi:MAG: YhjD/YihY/BrkB family envelope integrity protein, partial [Micromonosporaceae bacterium]